MVHEQPLNAALASVPEEDGGLLDTEVPARQHEVVTSDRVENLVPLLAEHAILDDVGSPNARWEWMASSEDLDAAAVDPVSRECCSLGGASLVRLEDDCRDPLPRFRGDRHGVVPMPGHEAR
jgi:hypothetical protein